MQETDDKAPSAASRSLGSWVQHAFDIMAALTAFIMMVHVAGSFLARYLFSYPLYATLAIVANYYMVILVFVGLVWAVRGDLIGMTLVVSQLRAGVRRWFAVAAYLITAGYVGVLAFATTVRAISATKDGEMVDTGLALLSTWQSRWIVAVCLILVTLFQLERAFTRARVDPAQSQHDRQHR